MTKMSLNIHLIHIMDDENNNLTTRVIWAPMIERTYEKVDRCAGRNPSSVLGGIRLNGLPASRAGVHRRLFALSPRWVGRLTLSARVLNASSASSPFGQRSRFCPEPELSPCASRRRGPAKWMEFPQALLGSEAAHRLTDRDI